MIFRKTNLCTNIYKIPELTPTPLASRDRLYWTCLDATMHKLHLLRLINRSGDVTAFMLQNCSSKQGDTNAALSQLSKILCLQSQKTQKLQRLLDTHKF